MTPPGLADAYFKTERAKAHFDELYAALRDYMSSDPGPYKVDIEKESMTGSNILKVTVQEPHVWIFLILGDFLHCLRSALDHAVWRIADLNGTPARGIQFPIIETRDKAGIRLFERQTVGIPNEAVSVIEAFQPYNRGDGIPASAHLLWRLGTLTNIDKHRRIPIHATAVWTEIGRPPVSIARNDGNTVFRFIGPSDDDIMGFYPSVSIEIVFGSEADGISLIVSELFDIYKLVAWKILPALARFDP